MTQIPLDYAVESASARLDARRQEYVDVAVSDISDTESRQETAAVAGEVYDQRIAAYLRTIRQ